jgi:VIT1/CCC1 family predicted Fe2+/Mn2+ transporter
MANCDTTIFHWVSQYQLMPVWQEYPPPCTAYESYYLERDRQKYYLGCSDHREAFDSHRLPPYIQPEVHETKPQPIPISTNENFSSPYLSNPSYSPSFSEQSSISESPQPKMRLYPISSSHHNPLMSSGGDLSLESSDFSQEEIKEEESEDVENSEEDGDGFAAKRKNSFDLSAMNDVSQQPRKRQRTSPEQLEVLEKVYEHEKLPNSDLRKELAQKLKMTPRRVEFIKDVIYGGLDGIISVFVTVAAASGSNATIYKSLILGIAKWFAGGVSMAVGDGLATDAERDMARRERKRETWELENFPAGEVEEMVELYVAKGVPEDTARRVMNILVKYPRAFVSVMMAEELGIPPGAEEESPALHAVVTFVAFTVFGLVPLLAYVLIALLNLGLKFDAKNVAFYLSIGVTAVTLAGMGLVKARVTKTSWWKSLLMTLGLGGFTAFLGWLVVFVLNKIFPGVDV